MFITFEGIDGCGKSTQIGFLAEYMRELDIEYITTREPGGSPIAEKIRELLLDPENSGMNIYAELMLYAAAREQHINDVIKPAIAAGKVVLCDRYVDSNVAYQGYGRGIGRETVLAVNKYAMAKCCPDVTFFFDFSPESAAYRKRKRTTLDRLELEDDDFFERVYRGFKKEAELAPERIMTIDVSGTKYETRDKMRAIFDMIMERAK